MIHEQIKQLSQHIEQCLLDIDEKKEDALSGIICFAAHEKKDGVQFVGTLAGEPATIMESIYHGMTTNGNLSDNIEVVTQAHDVLCAALALLKKEQERRIKSN